MFKCGASVAEGCSALNQQLVFDTNNRTFQMLQINIQVTVVNASNTKRRRNVVSMFGQRCRQWYSIKPTKQSESKNLKFQSDYSTDHCQRWFHIDCQVVSKNMYSILGSNDISWCCINCGLPNLSTGIFDTFSVNSSTTASSLSILTSDDSTLF